MENSKEGEIISFIASWNEELGPELIDFYPKSTIGDYEKLALHIFLVYQFFWDTPDAKYQKINIVLPINRLNKKAKVLYDIRPNLDFRGGLQPFIVVILVPDYFKDEELTEYNEIMLKISQEISQEKEVFLKDYYPLFMKRFALSQSIKEEETKVSEYYSYTAAMEDFQAGINLFKSKNFDQAYETLKKVLNKFEYEDNKHLIMEALNFIASLFTQQKKFEAAKEYYNKLEQIAEELDNKKYLETSIFMQGFCDYKNEKYTSAKKKFAEINIKTTQFINKLQYYTIYGRIIAHNDLYEEALQALLKALTISNDIQKSDLIKRQQSQILYELGVINNKIAVERLRNSGFSKKGAYNTFLQDAIRYFEQAAVLLIELKNFDTLVQVYQLIGNIFEFQGNDKESLNYYNKALNNITKSKNPNKKVIILNRIVQKQIKLKMYEENVNLINEFISNIEDYKFIDLYTISRFHQQLGRSLIATGKKNEGLSELLKAFEILKSFKTPVAEEYDLLNQIIEIYTELKDNTKVDYYSKEIDKVSNKLKTISIQKPKNFRPLSSVKEIWIFHSTIGVEIFSYALDSKIDTDLLGGFLTAMQQFSLEISQKSLNDMIIGDDCYMIYQEEGFDFYILGRADMKVPKEVIKTILSKIFRRFWKEFAQKILGFQGNVKHFQSFTKIIESLDLSLTS